jgi:GTP-binding protein Era
MIDNLPSGYKSGYVTIIGYPNAGKSTLMNALLDIKLSITPPKPQTTRKRVVGILNKENFQSIFLDTPGLLKPRYELQEKMMNYVDTALQDADVLLIIVDASAKRPPLTFEMDKIKKKEMPIILILNKIDLVEKQVLLQLIDRYQKIAPFKAIIPVSALNNDGTDILQEEMVKYLPLGHPFYPPDAITDHPEKFFAAEIIREKIFLQFEQEIPYSTEVTVEIFKEDENNKNVMYIYAVINVERKTQKGILIGKQGAAIKKLGQKARKDIEALIGKKIYLDLNVKIAEGWRKSSLKLKRLGY